MFVLQVDCAWFDVYCWILLLLRVEIGLRGVYVCLWLVVMLWLLIWVLWFGWTDCLLFVFTGC